MQTPGRAKVAEKEKRLEELPSSLSKNEVRLVAVGSRTGERATDFGVDCGHRIAATTGTSRFVADVQRRSEQFAVRRSVGVVLLHFQCPGSLGSVHLLQVRDAGVLLAGGEGLHEVRNRHGRKQANDLN